VRYNIFLVFDMSKSELDLELDEDQLRLRVERYAEMQDKVQMFRDMFSQYPVGSTFVIYKLIGTRLSGKLGGVGFTYGYCEEDPYGGSVGDLEITLVRRFGRISAVYLRDVKRITYKRRFQEHTVWGS